MKPTTAPPVFITERTPPEGVRSIPMVHRVPVILTEALAAGERLVLTCFAEAEERRELFSERQLMAILWAFQNWDACPGEPLASKGLGLLEVWGIGEPKV
jgi:hypothetical protein